MNFGDAFSKAWNTVWKHKVLWIFGFFASLLALPGGNNGGNSGNSGIRYEMEEMPRMFQQWGNWAENLVEEIGTGEWIALGLGMFVLIVLSFLIAMFFGHLGRGAVVKGTVIAKDGEKLTFGQLWKAGLRPFWKLLALTALEFAAGIALAIVVIILAVITLGLGAIVFACLALPIAIAAALWMMQATIFIVVEEEDIFQAIGHAWTFVFEEHLGNYLLMGLLVAVASFFAGLVILVPLLLLGIPTALALFTGQGFAMLGIAVGIIALVIYLPFFIIAQGLRYSFIWSAWTHFYQDLITEDARQKEELEQLVLEGGMPGSGEML